MSLLKSISALSKVVSPHLYPLIALDKMLARRAMHDDAPPPVFIVGAPRSGTTIIYQLLLTGYRFTYLSNIDSVLFTLPTLCHFITHRFKDKDGSKGETSNFGYVSGTFGPNESGPFMRYFLEQKSGDLSVFKNTCTAIASLSKRPLLTKNTLNSLRVATIAKAFPNAFIIWIKRNPNDLQSAILRMRKNIHGDVTQWAGAKPKGWQNHLNKSPEEQVIWQINSINEAISRDITKCNLASCIIDFDDCLDDTNRTLERAIACYRDFSNNDLQRNDEAIPNKLRR